MRLVILSPFQKACIPVARSDPVPIETPARCIPDSRWRGFRDDSDVVVFMKTEKLRQISVGASMWA